MASKKPSPPPAPPGKVRDAGTGRYVPPSEAAKRPNQTVTEHDKKKR